MASQIQDPVSLLAFMQIKGVGRKKALRIAEGQVALPDDQDMESLIGRMNQIVEAVRRSGDSVIGFFDPGYPSHLRDLKDPPAVLFCRGDTDLLRSRNQVAVIGSRLPGRHGLEAVRPVISSIVNLGCSVVSGLARGIDTEAHRRSIELEGSTTAILPSGLSRVYPPENEDLAAAIADSSGVMVSEYLPDEGPEGYRFVERDRIQAGLSKAVIVMDTGLSGGTLHTVKFAAETGRRVLCPSLDGEVSKGVRALLSVPACDLYKVLPSWKSSRKLCGSLPSRPLATSFHPADADQLEELLG